MTVPAAIFTVPITNNLSESESSVSRHMRMEFRLFRKYMFVCKYTCKVTLFFHSPSLVLEFFPKVFGLYKNPHRFNTPYIIAL